jgi:DNA polymerase-3 subunit alpha
MAIRYGLAAIKNVGASAMQMSIEERDHNGPFNSLEDFCSRLGARIANRKLIESLVKAGAFDFVGRDRAELFDCVEQSLAASAAAHRDREAGQVSLFADETHLPSRRKRGVKPWSEHEKLSYEKELLGFYVSGHPLDAYVDLIAAKNFQSITSLSEMEDRTIFKVVGAITQIDRKFTRREGKPFAVVWIEDLTGTLEVVIWNEVYLQVADALATGRVIAIQGTIDTRGESVRATAQKVRVLANGNGKSTGASSEEAMVLLRFTAEATKEELREVREILATSPGERPVQLLFDRAEGDPFRLDAGTQFRVELTRELEEKLARWLVTTKSERRE